MRKTAVFFLLLVLFAQPALARVVRIEVTSREDVLDGREFGLAGAYEKIAGRVYFAVDPDNAANRIITDIDKAPRNAAGEVEFSAEFFILKPKDMGRANGAILFEVGNRGGKGLLSFFNFARGSADPTTEDHFGDGLLLREGYTLLWVGWQFDTPEVEGRMRMYPPTATDDGEPIRGLVRSDFVTRVVETDHSLADRNHIPYLVADPDAAENVMTVRDAVESPRRAIPRAEWGFGRIENGRVVEDFGRVWIEGGFAPQRIYEVVYLSEGPPLVGLGPTGIRDFISELKYGSAAGLSMPEGAIDRAIGFGISQSGRFLRTFLYYGFNEDEAGRKVFDGVISHVAGGGRGSFNHRFAQASRDAHPFLNIFYPTDIFPFTDVEQTDPETGLTDGLFSRQKAEHLPKVFYTNSSYEYWGRAASLIHTSIDGKSDVTIPDNVRVYLFAGSQHGPSRFPPARTSGQQLSNPTDFRYSMRALLKAMNGWIKGGPEAPSSRYPRIDLGELVSPEALFVSHEGFTPMFPELPGVGVSTAIHKAYRADYGPQFRTEGIVTREPPEIGSAFPMLVPAVDEDGNEVAGIQMPGVAVPLATYTGWNLFVEGAGPTNELSSMQGSFLPFARTRSERTANGDPRPSIEERYEGREQYLGLIATVAIELVDAGYLLAEDVPAIIHQAGERWEHLVERR